MRIFSYGFKVPLGSWFDLIGIIFYSYCLVVTNLTGSSISFTWATTITLIFYIVLYLNHQFSKKGNQVVENYIYFMKPVVFFAAIIIFMIGGGSASSMKIINWVSPLFFYFHAWFLMKNTSISNNNWLRVQSTLYRYMKDNKIILMKPVLVRQKEGFQTTSYVLADIDANSNHQRFDYFKGKYKEVTFENLSLLFSNNDSDEPMKFNYEIPSAATLQLIDRAVDLRIDSGNRQLRLNTLTNIFLSYLFDSLENNKLPEFIDVRNYTDKRHNFHIILDYKNDSVRISHTWNIDELHLVSSRILDAVLSSGGRQTDDQSRLNFILIKNLENYTSATKMLSEIIISYLILLAKSGSNDSLGNNQKWLSAAHSFATSTWINLEKIFQNLNLSTELGLSTNKKINIQRIIDSQSKSITRFMENPTESFIQIHDDLLRRVGEINEEQRNQIDQCFDRIIHNLMDQLSDTSYKQHRARVRKYSLNELVGIRSGYVVGATIALQLLRNYLE
jgi:hypothetical protein